MSQENKQYSSPDQEPHLTVAEDRKADVAQSWTGDIPTKSEDPASDEVYQYMAAAFDRSPFLAHNQVKMSFREGRFFCEVDMQPSVVGNVAFGILHGGATATLLDSVGGIEAMGAIYHLKDEPMEERMKKIGRLATIDMRVDYLAPGRGNKFMATAKVLRLGTKTCTTQMEMVNDEGKLIAIGTATYGF